MAPVTQRVSGLYRLVQQVKLPKMVRQLSAFQPGELMMLIMSAASKRRPKVVPPVNGDFYDIADLLSAEERQMQARIREYMETEVRPIIGDYWERGEFPHELLPGFAKLIGATFASKPYSIDNLGPLMTGVACMEMARVDPSIYTFFGVHWGLCMGSIHLFGSEAQKARWLPAMEKFERIGSWALTEPEVGSATAAGMTTTARKENGYWILNGEKKWSGNAPFADVNVIFARDVSNHKVAAFLVERGTPGYSIEKLEGKTSLRVVQNANIKLENCRVPEANRLPGVTSFRDIARQLGMARAAVAWSMTGTAMGAYEQALDYANNRIQFGRPIASFQLIQNNLVRMVANVTAMQTMCVRLSQLYARDGKISQERASLAKVFCGEHMRETVAIARSALGGNGILLEHDVARFFADAEALYSYEGTHEMNTLIVGRALTGISSFV
jgi:glutaryl-CoA dehydrogenase